MKKRFKLAKGLASCMGLACALVSVYGQFGNSLFLFGEPELPLDIREKLK